MAVALGLLARLLAEPGGEVVRDALAEQAAVMSAVNWAEVRSRLASAGADPDEVAQRLASEAELGDVLTVVALTGSDGPALRGCARPLAIWVCRWRTAPAWHSPSASGCRS